MRLFAAACAVLLAVVSAQARPYPPRPVPVVRRSLAGGPSDVVARIVAENMGKLLGQTMVIENVGGAGGTIGSARVASAAPGRHPPPARGQGLPCGGPRPDA